MLEVPEDVRNLVADERSALSDLRVLLAQLEADETDLGDVRTAAQDLDGLFMIVVVGEFNAGKSSLVNALVGDLVMPEGVTPTTDRVTVVTHGDKREEAQDGHSVVRRTFPIETLRDIALVDTPGTNAIILEHQEITERFVPRADLLLFVTSADRPYTESERSFLELIASWGRKVIVVINKIDILETDEQRREVIDYVRQHARQTLGLAPEVFGVSAKRAFQARQVGDETSLQRSGLLELEASIRERLGSERIKLKLLSPIGVAQHQLEKYQGVIEGRLKLLTDDGATLEEIERQRAQFTKDLRRELDGHLIRVKDVLRDVESRGHSFFDDLVRFRRIPTLVNTQKVRDSFEAEVLKDTGAKIDRSLGELVDWFINRNLQFWEDVMGFVNERRAAEEERVIGEVGGRFQYDRQALMASLRDRAADALKEYDGESEAVMLADRLQGAVFTSGLLNVGGVGLSAAVLAAISSTALDITGVLLGLTLVSVGLLVLPRQRAKAKRDLSRRMQELRDGLEQSLTSQFEVELERSLERLVGAISPYTRFVRSELDRLGDLREELGEMTGRFAALKRFVNALG
ncbi:MAG: dynamin family protein [Trueperaceae bacterium]|nr:dynamin family protein [Trueperaceae bacterium]